VKFGSEEGRDLGGEEGKAMGVEQFAQAAKE
jgi:hypothetical protein